MIEKFYRFTCADCGFARDYKDKDEPRNRGWAVSHGEKNCYCPACAFKHRNTGCKGTQKTKPNVKQIEISEVQDSA